MVLELVEEKPKRRGFWHALMKRRGGTERTRKAPGALPRRERLAERMQAMNKPFFVQALEQNDRPLLGQMTALQEFVGRDGALPAKVKTLMSMLADAILGHPEGVRAIAEQARAQGASEPEIAETVRVAFLAAGMPGLVTGVQAFRRQG